MAILRKTYKNNFERLIKKQDIAQKPWEDSYSVLP